MELTDPKIADALREYATKKANFNADGALNAQLSNRHHP